jgi:hypothetical protein
MSTKQWKYLHRVQGDSRAVIHYMDHRIRPETRAMFAAMVSRMPRGGIQQRYEEVLRAIVEDGEASSLEEAEELLCSSIPRKVKSFMDVFVGDYGHSSILELTGSPTVFIENISWLTAWLSFDGPLVKGQELSTRAKGYADWPMCAEAPPELEDMHKLWLSIFSAEVEWWTEHLKDPIARKSLGISDNEPFRPAFDRARWALPGTISTGVVHTSNVRDMGRVLADAKEFVKLSGDNAEIRKVWEHIDKAYLEAMPAVFEYRNRSAVHSDTQIETTPSPRHRSMLRKVHLTESNRFYTNIMSPLVGVGEVHTELAAKILGHMERSSSGYLHYEANRVRRAIRIQCSIAAARDWHRHRTLFPWTMSLVGSQMYLHADYLPKSDYARNMLDVAVRRTREYLRDCRDGYLRWMALPLGTAVELEAVGGLRDLVYTMELRSKAHGTNFEYREQAKSIRADLGLFDGSES